jgi:hypothetical protein
MSPVTTDQFQNALRAISRPGGHQLKFIAAHERASSRAATFSQLAKEAGYRSYRAINLHYGKLARRIGDALGLANAGIELLMEPHRPASITNREWVLVMRPEFATALRREGWV